jgi:hypothetical protein
VAGGDLYFAEADVGVEHGVTKVWRSMCGCILGIRIPAACARCLSRRVAACRSIRAPRVLRRIGPVSRPSAARSIALAIAGGSGMRAPLAALAADPQDAVIVFFADVTDAGAAGFEDPQPEQ